MRVEVCGDSEQASVSQNTQKHDGHGVDAQCTLSHGVTSYAISSGESECYGIVKCAAIGFGARSMLADFGMCADVVVRTDWSSGLAVGSRGGLGRRHVQARCLWVQQCVQEGDLRLKRSQVTRT